MRLPEKTTDSSVAQMVKTHTKKNVKKDRRKCFRCHQIGHLAKNCTMTAVKNAGQSRQSLGGESFCCYRDEDIRKTCKTWVADSGAS
ncbi:hypothetical protein T07_1798 [Trichinella nelsoni]|uniref:CCHC-type domain-containing protein n=1 Tax=Trichinella nelsoni TaxID=6336 RepID=A0A0V0RVH9_9BILA|nr:hypothetical protein T07_1798 [Trichinella nelsoni]